MSNYSSIYDDHSLNQKYDEEHKPIDMAISVKNMTKIRMQQKYQKLNLNASLQGKQLSEMGKR